MSSSWPKRAPHSNQVGRFDADGAKALETIEFAGLATRFDDTVGEEYHAITGPETKVNWS